MILIVSNAVDTKLKVILRLVWPIAKSIIMLLRVSEILETQLKFLGVI